MDKAHFLRRTTLASGMSHCGSYRRILPLSGVEGFMVLARPCFLRLGIGRRRTIGKPPPHVKTDKNAYEIGGDCRTGAQSLSNSDCRMPAYRDSRMPVASSDFTGSAGIRRYHRASATAASRVLRYRRALAPRNRVVSDSSSLPIRPSSAASHWASGGRISTDSAVDCSSQFSQGLGFSSVTSTG